MFKKGVKSTSTAWDISANENAPNYEAAFSLSERYLAIGTGWFLKKTQDRTSQSMADIGTCV